MRIYVCQIKRQDVLECQLAGVTERRSRFKKNVAEDDVDDQNHQGGNEGNDDDDDDDTEDGKYMDI